MTVVVEDGGEGGGAEEVAEAIADVAEAVADAVADTAEAVAEAVADAVADAVDGEQGGDTDGEIDRAVENERRFAALEARPVGPSYEEVANMIDSRLAPVAEDVAEVVAEVIEEAEDGEPEEVTVVTPDVQAEDESRKGSVLSKLEKVW